MLAFLLFVDAVTIFPENTPIKFSIIKPDIHVKVETTLQKKCQNTKL